jgi:hypothetical protein
MKCDKHAKAVQRIGVHAKAMVQKEVVWIFASRSSQHVASQRTWLAFCSTWSILEAYSKHQEMIPMRIDGL